jgi:hypothetical protein
MTPKEKAEELVLKFREVPQENTMMWYAGFEISKEFALIAVSEIIKALRKDLPEIGLGKGYWYDVKQEIESL